VKSVWSIALSWEVRSQLANVFFDGASDVDVNLLLDSLNAAPIHHLGHPLLIPCLLLDQLGIYYNENWRGIARELFQIERKLGLTRGRSKANPWSWNQSRFRSITYDISDVTTGLVYIERRLNFTLNLANNLEKNITSIDHDLGYDAHRNRASQYLQEKLGNTISFLENQIHQVKCLQKRSEAFTNTASISIHSINVLNTHLYDG
jgi:hypothetical protein